MGLSAKEQMLQAIRDRDEAIKGVKESQVAIVVNYVKNVYDIAEKDIFFLNDTKVKLHHITYSDSGRKINLHYQRVKHNGGVESTIFTACIGNHVKITKE